MNKIKRLLMEAIFEVMEKMYFINLEQHEEKTGYHGVVDIVFPGPHEGRLEFCFSRGLMEAMVINMMGVSIEEINETYIEDCAREAVNMISGAFKRRIPQLDEYDMTLPLFTAFSESNPYFMYISEKALCQLNFTCGSGFMGATLNLS